MVSDVPTWEDAAAELGLQPLHINSNPSGRVLIADLLAFRQEPDAYGCVITDFNMPGMNGLELGGLLRAIA